MTRYRLADRAVADLRDIFGQTYRRWGFDQAEAYRAALVACIEAMAGGSARNRSIAVGGKRFWRHRCRHRNIMAISTETGLLILAILHERMDLTTQIRGRSTP